ncbi:Putative zincin peptidase [Chitinophaga sp. YR627]|uniref:metalloprotease family protein n=1 Tax=Chitinophaga sp. YR627 TaxID=1881041 RepID=UPI0008EF3356|nr:metalloprotease family protein [Chitinophaga sp. YR627]SFN75098.1 Putative zincin peptidase [Chitinophaga sp. YR627]
MFIPGPFLALVTFPGVIVHEFAHQLFCRIFGVAIFEVKYFQMANPVGYVKHEPVRNPVHQLLIGTGPFIINTLIALLIAFPAAIPVFMFNEGTILDYLLLYLGLSIGMHAFPSTGDANVLWQTLWHGEQVPLWLKIITVPIVGLIYLGAIGSFFWLDLIYGMGVAFGLPVLIVQFCA